MSVAIVPEVDDDWAKDLNYQQETFVLEFEALGWKNPGRAAMIAQYAQPQSQGPRLLTNVKVAAAIALRRQAFYQAHHIGRDRILWELANIAGFDFGEIMRLDGHGNPHLDLSMASEAQTRVLKEIETSTERLTEGRGRDAKTIGTVTKVKVKTHDKLAALRLLMQHLGMIQEGNTNVQVNVDFGDLMEARRQKLLTPEGS